MKKFVHISTIVLFHTFAVTAIIISFWPMGKWYYAYKALWGVDFYYTASLVNLLKHNFVLPNMNWGYAWFSGWPMLSSYPILHYFLIVPLTNFFPLLDAVKIWMLFSLIMFFVGIYATCYILSKNYAVSFVIGLSSIYSVGVYGTLMWGGSLPSHATQAFFPWVVFFIIYYLKTQKNKFLFASSLLAGLAILSHPQIVIAYIYPTAILLFLFTVNKMKFLKRIKALTFFFIFSFLIGLPLLYSSMGGALKSLVLTNVNESLNSTVRTPSGTILAIEAFHRAQPYRIYIDTNTVIFILLVVAIVLFAISLISRHIKDRIFLVIPYIFIAIFSAGYVWIFSYGISIYHGGWYRLFWAVPVWLGMLIAACWGAWEDHLKNILKKKYLHLTIHTIISCVVLILGIFGVYFFAKGFQDKIILRSTTSSAYPDTLNLHTSTKELEELQAKLIPSWIDATNTQFRLYAGDQTINIWWNALYKMPLGRGYFDPPVTALNKGYFFLLDTSLSQQGGTGDDQLVGTFHYPPKVALNNTLFFTDWYSIKYIESGPTLAAYTPLPKSFNNTTYIKRDQKLDFNNDKYNTGDMSLHFYEVKDEFVSPIFAPTNSPTIGIIASNTGYETILRGFADMNFSAREGIPVRLGQFIDKVSSDDLSSVDSLIVYDYKYSDKNKAFKLLSDYVTKGKKLFIDTGVEVKEANATDLPDIFPFSKNVRRTQGTSWDFEVVEKDILKGSDINKFDPPLFDKEPWSISYPPEDSNLRTGAKILLKNRGVPVVISKYIGNGEVLWSGINLPYHVIRNHNIDEVNFFRNILGKIISPSSSEKLTFDAKFINPQKREIAVQNAKGVLLKEQAYSGWGAHISNVSVSQNLKIFQAGPAYPGFMYVRLPEKVLSSKSTITFSYNGSLSSWIFTLLAFLVVYILLEEIFLNGVLLGRTKTFVWKKLHFKVKSWWGKDD